MPGQNNAVEPDSSFSFCTIEHQFLRDPHISRFLVLQLRDITCAKARKESLHNQLEHSTNFLTMQPTLLLLLLPLLLPA